MNGTAEGGSLERLAYELSVSALRHQETSLTELRERTGTLLAASSIVASFLGARALDDGFGALTVFGLLAFVLSVFTSVYVLFPKASFIFALRGSVLFEEELSDPGGLDETYRRLAYWLEDYHDSNQTTIERLFLAYRAATFAVLLEVLLWSIELAVS
jgi:hypothetical protein